MKHLPIRELTLCALFCALTALGAFLTIPLPYGQITLQWLFAVLTGFVLAPRAALFSQIAYLLLGLMGAPVFSGFSGGISAILSPTFGFVPGMVICAPLHSHLPLCCAVFPQKNLIFQKMHKNSPHCKSDAVRGINFTYFLLSSTLRVATTSAPVPATFANRQSPT